MHAGDGEKDSEVQSWLDELALVTGVMPALKSWSSNLWMLIAWVASSPYNWATSTEYLSSVTEPSTWRRNTSP